MHPHVTENRKKEEKKKNNMVSLNIGKRTTP